MGGFSELCKGCGKSIVADVNTGASGTPYGEQGVIGTWMSDAVVLTPSGSVIKGSYDGCGRLNDAGSIREDVIGAFGGNEAWHEACWELAGSPLTFTSTSEHDDEQGFWQKELAGLPDPRTTPLGCQKMAALKAAAETAPVAKKKAAKKPKKAGSGIGFFVPGLDPNDPESVRKALSRLVLDPQKYLVG